MPEIDGRRGKKRCQEILIRTNAEHHEGTAYHGLNAILPGCLYKIVVLSSRVEYDTLWLEVEYIIEVLPLVHGIQVKGYCIHARNGYVIGIDLDPIDRTLLF